MIRRGLPLVVIAWLAFSAPAIPAAPAHDTAAHEQKPRRQARVQDRPYGRAGDARKVKRVIAIEMSDAMRFFPSELRVKRGETVRFELRNGGQLAHGMVIGTMEELKKHAELMKKNGHSAPAGATHAAHLEPGATGRIVWQFTRPGEFYYACVIPGHFDAGMIGTIVVR